MNLKLSYRDKVIFIVVMVILVLVAGFFLFIKPKFADVESAKATLETTQQEKAEIDAKIDTLPGIIDNLKAAAKEIEEEQKIFMDEAHPYVNETYIREALGSLNIDITEMKTNYTTSGAITRYNIGKEHILAYENKINADLYNELPQEVYDEYNGVPLPEYPEAIVGVTRMSVVFDSSFTTLQPIYDVMDRIAEDEKAIILNTVSTEQDVDKEDTLRTTTVNLTMYSIFPLNVEKVQQETTDIPPIEATADENADENAETTAAE